MSRIYQRRATITIGTGAGEGLRVASEGERALRFLFRARKVASRDPNTLDLEIRNLGEDSRSKLAGVENTPITLEAGYLDNVGAIFIGKVRSIDNVRSGTEWTTRVQAADGLGASKATLHETLAPNTQVGAAIQRMAEQLGKKAKVSVKAALARAAKGDLAGAGKTFAKGLTIEGNILERLDGMGKEHGFEVSVQDEELLILKPGETATHRAVVLSPSTGLVGSPERIRDEKRPKDVIVKLRAFMIPALIPGGLVELESDVISGRFRATEVSYQGDTHGPAWHTEIEAVAV